MLEVMSEQKSQLYMYYDKQRFECRNFLANQKLASSLFRMTREYLHNLKYVQFLHDFHKICLACVTALVISQCLPQNFCLILEVVYADCYLTADGSSVFPGLLQPSLTFGLRKARHRAATRIDLLQRPRNLCGDKTPHCIQMAFQGFNSKNFGEKAPLLCYTL